MIKWHRPQIRATDPGPEAPSRSKGSSRGRDGEPGRWQPPAPRARPARVAVVTGCLAGAACWILMTWLHPHGVMTVAVILASSLLALTTAMADQVLPVPRDREETRDE